jgi:hypothetical protein
VKLHGDKLQAVLVRHHDADRLAGEFNNLLLHDRLPHWLQDLQLKTNDNFQERKEPEALHSTARKGAAIRAIHFKRIPTKGGDASSIDHVTLLLFRLRGQVGINPDWHATYPKTAA